LAPLSEILNTPLTVSYCRSESTARCLCSC